MWIASIYPSFARTKARAERTSKIVAVTWDKNLYIGTQYSNFLP